MRIAPRPRPRPQPRPPARPTPAVRTVVESAKLAGPSGPALRIDKEKKIIYGVRVLGRFSPNCHGIKGVTEGTEYTPKALQSAVALYEGVTIFADHPERKNPTADRSVRDALGVLRNCRVEGSGNDACVRADLHYLASHELSESVVEDVERALGVYGLSHNADWGEGEVRGGRLVIETLETVRSVDLVDKPATNTNLWESRTMPAIMTSLRSLLEGKKLRLTPQEKRAARDLLEDDAAGYADAPIDGAAEMSPEEQLAAGFKAAILAVLDDNSLDAKGKLSKIGEFLKTHEKLLGTDDEADPVEEEEEEDYGDKKPAVAEEEEDDEEPKKATESLRQRLVELERKDECRELCESLDFVPSKVQLKALMALEGKDRRDLAESFVDAPSPKGKGVRESAPAPSRPRSSGPKKAVTEAKKVPDAKSFTSRWVG